MSTRDPDTSPGHVHSLKPAALWYASIGWPVFPVQARGKRPLVARGFLSATADANQIDEWWTRSPQANIGVRTGHSGCGAVVLDVDVLKGGAQSLAALGELPRGPRALTGSGGAHLFFAGFEIGNRANFRAGLDVRGDGGYVVAAPSIHACGRPYEWDANARPDQIALPAAPAWLASMLLDRTPATPPRFPARVAFSHRTDRARRYLAKRAPAIQGAGGDAHTFSTAAIVARGFDLLPEEALDAMADWNARCVPPWRQNELLVKIRNAIRYGREPIGGRLGGAV